MGDECDGAAVELFVLWVHGWPVRCFRSLFLDSVMMRWSLCVLMKCRKDLVSGVMLPSGNFSLSMWTSSSAVSWSRVMGCSFIC